MNENDNLFTFFALVFLVEYFMKAVLGKDVDTAVLMAPPIQLNGSVCIHFEYRLSHPKIILSIRTTTTTTTTTSNTSSYPWKLMELSYGQQTNASDWSAANVTLNSTDDEVQRVAFVAEKIGFTVGLEYAAIRNIFMNDSPCTAPGKHALLT